QTKKRLVPDRAIRFQQRVEGVAAPLRIGQRGLGERFGHLVRLGPPLEGIDRRAAGEGLARARELDEPWERAIIPEVGESPDRGDARADLRRSGLVQELPEMQR